MQWETVIGLEIHTQLASKSKIFSGASIAYGAEPNSQACIVDLGFPGVLPVLNEAAVDMALMFGLAVDAEIGPRSVFARKNYFYPDLPKGYQISQFELPIVGRGSLTIDLEDGQQKVIGITRAHLEEDAGKSLHEDFHGMSGIDLNRAGTPLLEIVSEPDMRSIKEAVAYARKIHQLVVYLGICDGNMQEGSFRVDANLSMRPKGQQEFGTRTELKNINSFRFLERAMNFERERQIDLLESGKAVVQETRLYDADRDETRSMRSKEEANDYRYFPDPDLLPVEITEQRLGQARERMPELPDQKKARFVTDYQLSDTDATSLTQSRQQADYYEQVVATGADPKMAANWVTVELAGALNKAGLELADSPVSAEHLGGLLKRIADNTISGKLAKQVFEAIWQGEGDADTVIEAKGLKQITDSGQIESIIDEIIAANPKQVEQFQAGKEKLLGFFVGQVMKQTQGKANPGQVNQILLKKLKG
ncbi:MAG: Asp-tRNA(Asn)/Glu-tRNA(Gln) amidotransferase subunit GatB [Candidatus Thiodiazotropha lotti]|uniref:Aspartyl/glutamyl-tRNA(Asn/Gln) amidotransferase subunit B n=1 Tax=Candidatus Thiodiazotropha endoloripes TaxID=1818881 RepID=A0A1E2ULH5_9GAMM|nr:Asp-tRNA(Asn)/Glu-tRNA(Gln) amidotransferase subunit GatB [Candidatus Thiodiazotropha endoloripes]MCG7898651.1 Asp-tRNA(Asn)/Glu-tRNA(Gln) amidotransferase subunit GatB [Candidatus Thiodiazotropha weberae]MCG7991927.1 Asp-tRNA(Asn)/Glu-tRNA(Gln) amidotransferase subunit GatB [Candidatus Thiodiazotropha lotti]MCG7914886.1 Asp-tRNA(Asn)/Glu-tRNA(Gln) amidotransferase subunit GatB [Candidatus Thiodiazotropha weberae]MCG7998431.1 Asp-tRNA(Asn)/Glu-tRNA(Gln) amidotransferase subunit GatB [Candida